MPNGADWIVALAPLARDVYNKLTSGRKVTVQEQQFAMMFALVDTTINTQHELVGLREDLNRMCGTLNAVHDDVNKVLQDTAFLKGRKEGASA
jgi:hypothetical protein